MRTPSLRRRIVLSGLGVVLVMVVALEVFVAVSLHQSLTSALAQMLDARAEVVHELVRTEDPAELPERLAALGVPAVVTLPDGERVESLPVVPRFAPGPPGPSGAGEGPWITRSIDIPGGGEVEVVATRAGVDSTMRRVLLLMALGTLAVMAVGVLVLRRVARAVMSPLEDVIETARRTASGQTGLRLRADDPHSELGRVAVAYDEMLDELEDAVAQAQDAEERTRRFVDDAAHQLRTPVAALRATVEALLSTYDPGQRDRLMTHLVRETSRANRVLSDLLLMARLDVGRPPERASTDLAALLADEVERTRSLAPDLRVALRLPATPVPRTEVDPGRVRELFANLLDNARRHATAEVDVRLVVRDRGLCIRVDDDGPGVAPEARNLVFERFATLDGQGGSGLGLPIARAVAEAHGGELDCDQDGFEVRLPTTSDVTTRTAEPADHA